LQVDLTVAQAMDDPQDLQDLFEEALRADQHARVRKLAPVIIARLTALAQAEHEGARQAAMAVPQQVTEFKRTRPTLNAQLRAAEHEVRTAAQPIHARCQKAVACFKIGAASKHGIRL
jgi:hypothetical protein